MASRLRYNNQGGTISNLTIGATTITFGSAPDFATLSGGDFIPLALDAGTATFEIVYLTAYTAGATTGTITRGAEDATNWPAVAHTSSPTWVSAPLVADLVDTDTAGTVTSVSVVSANGMAGTVATATTTPAITLSCSANGILKSNGTTVSAASAGTDYLTPSGNGSSLTGIVASQIGTVPTGILKGSAGAFAAATAGTDYPATGVITGAGPTGSSSVVPVITYNANGQLTTVTTATVTPAAIGAPHTVVRTTVKTTTYAAAVNDLVPCDTTSGGFTVTLPTAPADGSIVEVKHIIQGTTSGSGNIVTVATGGSDVINRASGPTSVTLPINGQSRTFQYQTSTAIWTIVSAELPQTAYAVLTVTADPNPGVVGFIYRTNYAGSGNFTLPTSPATGSWIRVKQKANNTLSIVGTVDGNASFTMLQNDSFEFVYNGTDWDIH